MAAGLVIPRGSLYAGLAEVVRDYDSNVILAQFDLCNLQNGQLEVADTGENILGHVLDKTAVSATSENVQVSITPFATYVLDSDETGDSLAQDLVGEFFDITGGTGAQIVDISATTAAENPAVSGQVVLLEQNDGAHWNAGDVRDDLDGDTSVGLYMVVEAQFGSQAGA